MPAFGAVFLYLRRGPRTRPRPYRKLSAREVKLGESRSWASMLCRVDRYGVFELRLGVGVAVGVGQEAAVFRHARELIPGLRQDRGFESVLGLARFFAGRLHPLEADVGLHPLRGSRCDGLFDLGGNDKSASGFP